MLSWACSPCHSLQQFPLSRPTLTLTIFEDLAMFWDEHWSHLQSCTDLVITILLLSAPTNPPTLDPWSLILDIYLSFWSLIPDQDSLLPWPFSATAFSSSSHQTQIIAASSVVFLSRCPKVCSTTSWYEELQDLLYPTGNLSRNIVDISGSRIKVGSIQMSWNNPNPFKSVKETRCLSKVKFQARTTMGLVYTTATFFIFFFRTILVLYPERVNTQSKTVVFIPK